MSIWIRPPQEIADFIMKVKKALNVYYPDHEESSPHTTLYSVRFDEAKYPELLALLREIRMTPFEARIDKLTFAEQPLRNNVFVSFSYTEPEKFIELHKKVLAIANPLRGDLVRYKDAERYKNGKMTQEGWERTQKYGFQYFMDQYYPHITIGTIEMSNPSIAQELKSRLQELGGRSFSVNKIMVKFKRKSLPDEKELFESETTEVSLRWS